MQTVPVVGLGVIGSALAHALIADGYRVTIWNRSPEKAVPHVDAGATLARTVSDTVGASDATVVCIRTYADTRADQSAGGAAGDGTGSRTWKYKAYPTAEGGQTCADFVRRWRNAARFRERLEAELPQVQQALRKLLPAPRMFTPAMVEGRKRYTFEKHTVVGLLLDPTCIGLAFLRGFARHISGSLLLVRGVAA